ncbi:hypothetical protein LCGC14_2859170, partial [marine sediment metagenome]
ASFVGESYCSHEVIERSAIAQLAPSRPYLTDRHQPKGGPL